MTMLKQKGAEFLTSLSEGMKALSTLVKMQLKEKMDISYMKSKRQLIFKLVWLLIEFVAITAVITVVFNFVKLLGLFSLVHDIPISVISLVFAIMLLLSLVTDTVGLMKALYFSKDNTVLLTFPATPSLVFFSKLVTYYVYELRKSFMFTIPMFIAFGIAKGYSLYYYPWLLLMFALISTVPILLAALLSIPAMFLYVFLNRVKVLQYILYSTALVGGVVALWLIIGVIPADINFIETWGETYWQIQDFLKDYTTNFALIYGFTELIVGKTVGLTTVVFHSETIKYLAILVGISVLLLVLCFVCSKPLFCKMASTPFEFKKKNAIKEKTNAKLTPFISALKKEFTSGIRSNTFLKLAGVTVVIMPMAIYLLSKIYSSMNTRMFGTQMTVCFTAMIMLLILLMTNIDIASIYSRDGASSYLNKVQPASYSLLLYAKLFFPMLISLIGVIVTVVIYSGFTSLTALDTIMLGVAIYALYVVHMFSSAESDIMNPQYEQYATFNEQANNPNESISAVLAVIISAVIFVVGLFLSADNAEGVWLKIAVIGILLAAFKAFTFVSKIKAFYKEKQ